MQREKKQKSRLIYPQCFAREQVKGWRGKRKFMYLHTFEHRAQDYFIKKNFTHRLKNIKIHGRRSRWQLTLSGASLPFFLPSDETNFNHLWFILPECNRSIINSAAIRVERGGKNIRMKKRMKENTSWLSPPLPPFVWNTDQAPALSAQAGVLEPSPHVFVGTDDQRSDHQDPLPVLDDTLTTLFENKEVEGRQSTQVKRITHLFDLLKEGNLVKLEPMSPCVGCRPPKVKKKKKSPPKGCCRYCRRSVSSTWVRLHVPLRDVRRRALVQSIKLKRWRQRQEMQEFNL